MCNQAEKKTIVDERGETVIRVDHIQNIFNKKGKYAF